MLGRADMQGGSALVAFAFLITAVALLLLGRRWVRAPAWALFRCLLPAWRFFEQLEPVPVLSYRVVAGQGECGPWIPALIAPPRSLGSLILSARGNLHLACQTLVERLVVDLDGVRSDQVHELVSYQLVQALLETRLAESFTLSPKHYQFKLSPLEDASEDMFVSELHPF